MRAVRGISFEQDWLKMLDPSELDLKTIGMIHRQYKRCCPKYSWTFGAVEFRKNVRNHHIICFNGEVLERTFIGGIELMKDDEGPWINFLFLMSSGNELRLSQAGAMMMMLERMLWWTKEKFYADEKSIAPGRLFVPGRRGWQRLVKMMGYDIEADKQGFWIRERIVPPQYAMWEVN